jgi:hypothetical protein
MAADPVCRFAVNNIKFSWCRRACGRGSLAGRWSYAAGGCHANHTYVGTQVQTPNNGLTLGLAQYCTVLVQGYLVH